MIPNIVRGDRMSGLMVYLAGPGRHNEHTEPHLVGGDDALMAWYRDVELDRGAALRIAEHLDRPRRVFGTTITAGTYRREEVGRDTNGQPIYQQVKTGERAAHVWHCSLSLRADEGELPDEKWEQISRDFVAAMGFDDHQGTKAACRWVAVRHGSSNDGNDHIHLAVSLVREDGTKATTHQDFARAQKSARALEIVHGLERLESSVSPEPSASRGWTPGEQRQAEQRAATIARARQENAGGPGSWTTLPPEVRRRRVAAEWKVNLPRTVLARTVRGCAAAAADEAEFVRRMRRGGLLVRPRFAEGTHDVITGYSVAQRPQTKGERPVWYGGGRLARDLTLTRLRAEWPDSPDGATAAAGEWYAAYRGRRVVTPGREAAEPAPQLWAEQAAELGVLRRELAAIPVGEQGRDVWPRVARQASGVLSAWSTRVEVAPGHLAVAADALSRSAQSYRRQPPAPRQLRDPFAGAALLVAGAARLGRGPVGQAAVLYELMRLAVEVSKVAAQQHQTRQAERLVATVEYNLARVHDRLLKAEAAPVAAPTAVAEHGAAVDQTSRELAPELQAMVDRVRSAQASQTSAVPRPVPNPLDPGRRDTQAGRDQPDRARSGPER